MNAFDRATIVVGAAMAASGPFVGCHVGFGDNVQVTPGFADHTDVTSWCVDEPTNQLACFEYNEMSVSCMLTPAIAGTIFATGVVLFYIIYARCMWSLVFRSACFEQSGAIRIERRVCAMCICVECAGMLLTALVPMVTHTATIVHMIGFMAWMIGGFSLSIVMGTHALSKHWCTDWYNNKTRNLLIARMAVAPLLTVACLAAGAWRGSTGPLYRCMQYTVLLFVLTTGTCIVFTDTGSAHAYRAQCADPHTRS
jgi:hypothetical protein